MSESVVLPQVDACLRVIVTNPSGMDEWHDFDMSKVIVVIIPKHPAAEEASPPT